MRLDMSLRQGGIYAWKSREPAPCNCHRIHERAGRRWGEKPWQVTSFRIPPGLEIGDWCACMCPVHENPEPTDA